MQCPEDNRLAEFAEGALGPADAQAIAEHLDHCRTCADLVAEAAGVADDAWASELTLTHFDHAGLARPVLRPSTSRLPRGVEVGRYLVLADLGAGGLGEVYLGYDPELDRQVALKLVRPEVARRIDPAELKARFGQEARALARLSHPNVVQVYDVGTVGDRLFIAMERVEGLTLRRWLTHRKRSWTEIRDVFLAAGRGLAAAHEVGLVHRDFKPDNVLVGEGDRVWVLDFGLAQALDLPPRPDPSEREPSERGPGDPVRSRFAVGTPAYMAPEQYLRRPLDGRVDQFGFCVSLHEALYGVRPFRGRTPGELRTAICAGAIVPPSSTERVPSWLHRVVQRGLAVDPDERFESMHALLAALAHDRRSRRRNGIALGVAIVLSAVSTSVGVQWVNAHPSAAVVADIDALAEQAEAAAASGRYVYPSLDDPHGETAYRLVVQLESMSGAGATEGAARAAGLRQAFARQLLELGDRYWDHSEGRMFAADYYAAALLFEPDDPRAAERARITRTELHAMRDKASALDFSPGELEAGSALVALAEPDPRRRADKAKAVLGRVRATTASRIEAVVEPKESKRPSIVPVRTAEAPPPEPAPEPDALSLENGPTPSGLEPPKRDPASAKQHLQLGWSALRRGDATAAEAAFHRALRADPRSIDATLGLGEAMFQRGHYHRALELAERGGRLAPRDARAPMLEGNVYFRSMRYDDALTAYRRAQALGHDGAARQLDKLQKKLGKSNR